MVGGPAPASGKSHRSVDGDLRLSCTDLAAHSEELTLKGVGLAHSLAEIVRHIEPAQSICFGAPAAHSIPPILGCAI
jgi:hypothetical protein